MKILKIAFKNINSLKGENEIDFQKAPFDSNALFAITGPTGSGKSTILDVITLALYLKIPRNEKGINKTEIEQKGIILTKGQQEAYASVQYQCIKGTYTSTWSISTARTGNLRDYEMELTETHTGTIISDKKSEVPSKNEELIGLSYEQFVKSVMLAQGEFAKFLQVNKTDRSALLEKITGQDIYRKLSIRAFEKQRTIKQQLDELELQKKTWEESLLSDDELKNVTAESTALKENMLQANKQHQQLSKDQEQYKTFLTENDKLKATNRNIQAAEQSINQFEKTVGVQLQQHLQVEHIKTELNDWQRTQSELAQINKDLVTNKEEKEAFAKKQNTLQLSIEKLVHQPVKAQEVIDKLEEFESKVEKLVNQVERKQELYKTKAKECHLYLQQIDLALDSDVEITLNKVVQLKNEQQHLKTNLISHFDDNQLANKEQVVKELGKEISQLHQAKLDAQKIKHSQSEQHKLTQKVEQLNQQILGLPEKVEKYTEWEEKLELQLSNAQKDREIKLLKANLETHRKNLQDGEPCPLCGAIHHPYANHAPDVTVEQSEIQRLESELKQAKKEREEKAKDLALYQKSIAENSLELKSIQTSLKESLQLFEQQFKTPLETNWDQTIEQKEKQIQQLEAISKVETILKVCDEVELPLQELKTIIHEGKLLRKQKEEVYPYETKVSDATNRLAKEWNELLMKLNSIDTTIKNQLDKQNIHTAALQKLETLLQEKLADKSFESIDAANKALLSYDDSEKLKNKQQQLEKELIDLNGQKKSAVERIAHLQQSIDLELAPSIATRLTDLQTQLTSIQNNLEKANRLMLNHQDNKRKMAEIQKKIDSIQDNAKDWILLNKLIGSSSGDKFNKFAQELSLLHLLRLANKHLETLTKRYRVTNPSEDEDESLTIIDFDMGGLRRSVRTLSGGESFIISLALALALSDMASQQVKIDSLFIDEGFGTLDPETLDQTLDSLESLQQEGNKMIGIISHVGSLKDRIATQIQLSQNGQGYSEVNIVVE